MIQTPTTKTYHSYRTRTNYERDDIVCNIFPLVTNRNIKNPEKEFADKDISLADLIITYSLEFILPLQFLNAEPWSAGNQCS